MQNNDRQQSQTGRTIAVRTILGKYVNMAVTARTLGPFLAVVVLCCTSADNHGAEVDRDGARPNIAFILVDDLGWSDLGCYGNKFIETPCIESVPQTTLLAVRSGSGWR
jgi:hypothetical protein